MKHLDIRIYGRVQGVFFRSSARKQALSLGISGFAKNDSDGTVHIEAEGSEINLQKFLLWCKKGPLFSSVEKIDFSFSDNVKNFSGFSLL